MAKLTTDEILAYLEEATILELNELVKAIEEKFDVTAAAPVAVAAAAEEEGRGCGLPADPPGAEGPGVLSCGASQAMIPASCTGKGKS